MISDPHEAPLLLVAESDPLRLARLVELLEGAGYRVRGTSEGSAGLAAAAHDAPDLVLLDAGLDGDVLEACRALRHSGTAPTPILMLMEPEELDGIEAASAAGVTDFLTEPLHGGLVAHRVRSALAAGERGRAGEALVTVGAGPEAERVLADREAFLRSLREALERPQPARGGTVCLSVAVGVQGSSSDLSSPPEEATDELAAALLRRLGDAVAEFEFSAPGGLARGSVRIARLRGTRFAVLVPGLERPQDAVVLGSRVQEAFARTLLVGGQPLEVDTSIGVATHPSDGAGAEELLKCADVAAYCARQQGRNNLQVYTAAMNRWAFERLTLEHSLRQAVEREELVVYYQPRIAIRTGRVVGMEALVRWRHPQLGMISPDQFIPLAEETGLIIPVGEWVLRTATRQNKAWQAEGRPPIRIAVNLSSVQFRQPDLFETIQRILDETGLAPDWLELELTESMLMQDAKATVATLERLKGLGIHLSIDDFGTGYSSLSYLRRFPIDALKVDKSFMREVTSNADDSAIVTSIILMGHSLKLNVVAEGVETNSQLSFLRVLQCDEVQGYLFSPPVPAEEACKLIAG